MQENNSGTRKHSFQTTGLQSETKSRFSRILLFLIPLNVITFIVMIIFNAGASTNILGGVYKNNTGEISRQFEVSITPAGWTFSTWGIIYTWQALWLLFNVVIIFVRDNEGDRIYNKPAVLTPIFHLFILINFLLNTVWLIIWDRLEFTVAFVVIFLMTAALYVAIVISHRNTYKAELSVQKWVLWCYRILVNNGLAFYATWITVATTVNLAICITYFWVSGSDKGSAYWRSTSGIIGLSIIAAILLTYFVLDIYVFEKYLRYTFSPYIQLTIALAGILSKNWKPNEPAPIFTLVLLIIGPGIMFGTKIISTIYRVVNKNSI